MPFNLLKKYPELLEILHLNEYQRKESLMRIYKRDIEDNPNFKFREKQIYPIKSDGKADMGRQFTHLTCEEVQEEDENGNLLPAKRVFEKDRSQRLHWINHHIQELSSENIDIFSVTERDQRKRCDVTKTYIYDKKEKYVIVLECQRKRAAAKKRLLCIPDFLWAGILVQLFKPCDPNVSKRHLEGFDFSRIVKPEKQNLLPGLQIDALHWADGTPEFVREPQLADCPAYLGIHAGPKRISNLAEYSGVTVRVREQLQKQFDGDIRGFGSAASAFLHHLRDGSGFNLFVRTVK